jgi:hypothetical protein
MAKLGNLGWEDEKHKLNYIWFSLLEKPGFVRQESDVEKRISKQL